MATTSEIIGIHQSDVILRSALIAAIDDLRAKDYLLDFVFASLPKDALTKAEYGQREVDNAKRWFRSTKIPVMMGTTLADASFPVITFSLVDSGEAEVTLGDVHYEPLVDDDRLWPALTPVFEATGAQSGTVTVPDQQLVFAPGMLLIDSAGGEHPIIEVLSNTSFTIAPSTADFRSCVIKGQRPSRVTAVESVKARETYSIGCHVQGEQVNLTYLHSVLVFILYRYKQRLFEARGFERMTVTSSNFMRSDQITEVEGTYSRFINVSGYVTQVWPKDTYEKIQTVSVQPLIIAGAGTQTHPEDALWVGEEDALALAMRENS